MNQNNDPTAALVFLGLYLVFMLAIVILAIVCWCKIFGKAGFSPWMGLLMLVPFVGLIMILVLAFSEWPIQRELAMAKRRGGRGGRDEYDDQY